MRQTAFKYFWTFLKIVGCGRQTYKQMNEAVSKQINKTKLNKQKINHLFESSRLGKNFVIFSTPQTAPAENC